MTATMEADNRRAASENLPFHILAAMDALRKARNCMLIGARLGTQESCDLHSVELDLKELLLLVKKMREHEKMQDAAE
jgi:hypothetical protein